MNTLRAYYNKYLYIYNYSDWRDLYIVYYTVYYSKSVFVLIQIGTRNNNIYAIYMYDYARIYLYEHCRYIMRKACFNYRK